MDKINSHVITKICIVVRDIEKTAKYYCDLFGLDMPVATPVPPEEVSHAKYLGKPTQTRAKWALLKMGSIYLELLQPDDEPSIWRDFLLTHGEGLHNISFEVENLSETLDFLQDKGMPLLHIGEHKPGKCYANVDSQEQLGLILNLKEN